MDHKEEIREIELKLVKIIETGFYINTEEFNTIEYSKIADLKIEFGFKIDLQTKEDLFILDVIVKYIDPKNGANLKILELSTSNYFKIRKMTEFVSICEDKFEDKAEILPTLMGLSIGTLRGILFTKTVGTVMADNPLPIINPTELCNHLKNRK